MPEIELDHETSMQLGVLIDVLAEIRDAILAIAEVQNPKWWAKRQAQEAAERRRIFEELKKA